MKNQLQFSKKAFTIILLFLAFAKVNAQALDGTSFITTWKTDNVGTSKDTEITIPAIGTYDADWNNDGTFEEKDITGTHTHTFAASGTYTIRLRSAESGTGTLDQIFFERKGDRNKLLEINQWGTTSWTSMEKAFYGCQNLDVIAQDIPDLSKATSLYRMFRLCSDLIGNEKFKEWNVSTITNMNGMFAFASSFNLDINNWNVENVTDMRRVFLRAMAFNQNLSQWYLKTIEKGENMFDNSAMSTKNWDATLTGWAAKTYTNKNVTIGAVGLKYCDATVDREKMIGDGTFVFTGDVKDVGCAVLGVENFNINDVLYLYPNPTTGKVYISAEVKNVAVYNTAGQKIEEVKTNEFDISRLQSGLYYTIIESEKGIETRQLLKK